MSHHDMPPLYSHVSHTDTHPVPEYSELAHTSERVLHRSSTDPEGSRALSGARDYRYRTDNVEITIGPNPWGLLYAAYGRGGIVKGSVTFIKKATAVLQVTATVGVMVMQYTTYFADRCTVCNSSRVPLISRHLSILWLRGSPRKCF